MAISRFSATSCQSGRATQPPPLHPPAPAGDPEEGNHAGAMGRQGIGFFLALGDKEPALGIPEFRLAAWGTVEAHLHPPGLRYLLPGPSGR